ncbi:M20 family metallopeptidase, partial [Clostridioides difficile]|nr:M20 family metallopeptidase [Clostridioides difficile]
MIESIKKRAYEIENELGKEIEEVCNFIFDNPELGEEEYISSKYLVEKMKEYGFDTVYP